MDIFINLLHIVNVDESAWLDEIVQFVIETESDFPHCLVPLILLIS